MRLRRAVITAVAVAGIAVPVVSTAAVASAGSSPAPISATKSKPTKKPVRFEASGAVTGVNAATRVVTLQSKGKKTVVTEVTVAANASIVVNGVRTSLAAVGPGQWIVVTGTRTGSAFTATKLVVKGKRSGVTPRPTPTPTPNATPTTTPSPSSSPSDGEHSEDPDDDHGHHTSPHQ
ncbi:hypothetical protein [Actinoplanes solisilvae]|uniref:hypothetical protein n=1 Tax=Actinoplanes solisilvae TaxID=2486853 RepID=UPI000FDBE9FE|nr:hypothetical protein [Actinoplanes solisilvae]